MKDIQKETKPAKVRSAKQAGETQAKWWWVEPDVWTERMLATLERGVKGGKWFSLIDKVYSMKNLFAAFQNVRKNRGSAGVDRQTIQQFEQGLSHRLSKLASELQADIYRPQAIKRKYIPKPGQKEKRPLGIPTVRDRVTQTALRNVMEPIFEVEFSENSFGFRPGRSCKDALRRVDSLLKQGFTWVVDIDLKSYFDTIPHNQLMCLVEEKISDSRLLKLLRGYLKQDTLDGMKTWTPERGAPQGAIISPLLSNIYLHPLDTLMDERGLEMTRYADDMVILCPSYEEAQRAMNAVEEWTSKAGLTLHPEKTRIVDATLKGGFDFLGYHFERGLKWPRKKSIKKFRDAIRHETKRNNGTSLRTIVSKVNKILRGWFEYFKHSHKCTFSKLDAWVRMRLRSILRKRRGGKGRGRGQDHKRWPNAFFAEHGLLFLAKAHREVCQSHT